MNRILASKAAAVIAGSGALWDCAPKENCNLAQH